MDERTDPREDESFDDPTPDAEPQPPANAPITPGRRALWAVGGVVGGYMILRGVYGLITKDDEQPGSEETP